MRAVGVCPSPGGVMAGFQIFSKELVPLKREPTITIQKNGLLSLNKTASVLLGSPVAVELLYDRGSRTIGIRPVDSDVDHACALRSAAGPGVAPFVISALSFLRFYGIEQAV